MYLIKQLGKTEYQVVERKRKKNQGVNGNKNNLGKSIEQIKWNNDPQVHRISRESFNLIFNGWIFHENVAQSFGQKPNK